MYFLLVLLIAAASANQNASWTEKDDFFIEEPTSATVEGFYGFAGLNRSLVGATSIPEGGMFLEISQKGLDYLALLVAHAVPRLLLNFSIPEASGAGFRIQGMSIHSLPMPNITASFIPNVGIKADAVFSQIELRGQYEASLLWMSKSGSFRGFAENLILQILVTTKRGPQDQPIIQLPVCQGTSGEVRLAFGGGFSSVLNAVRGFVENFLSNEIGEILCEVLIDATKLLEKEMSSAPKKGGGEPDLLCGGENFAAGGAAQPLRDFTMDFSLSGEPYFGETHAVIGLKGDMKYKGWGSGLAPPQHRTELEYGEKMVTFVVTNYVPNAFFKQIHTHKLGLVDETLGVEDFPEILQRPLRLLCWGCAIRLTAGIPPLSDKVPKAYISKDGLRMEIKGETRMIVQSPFKTFDLIRANMVLEIGAKPYIKDGGIFAKKLRLSSYSTAVKEVGLGGMLGEPIKEMLNMLIPRRLWPEIKRRLRMALRRKGLQLPVVCGIKLQDTELHYGDGLMLADTNFIYNLGRFIAKLKKEINKETDVFF